LTNPSSRPFAIARPLADQGKIDFPYSSSRVFSSSSVAPAQAI